jgi:uncharacterized protein (TIGR02266 family)
MNELRKDRRAPASLKVKYKSATVDEFIEQFGADVSRGGIFIKTKKPLDTGALLKFEFQLQGGAPVIHGVGRVAWRRSEDKARADLPAGMGIKFIKLDEQSRAVIDRIEGRHGASSRFDQTDFAELAPPLSSLPPSPAPSGAPPPSPPAPKRSGFSQPSRRASSPLGANEPPNDNPTFRPPPPAVGSIPPPVTDTFPPRGRSTPAPKGALGSFLPDPAPRKGSSSLRSTSRDTSEFLASAFSVGGAGHEVRSQARVQVERARRDPESVDLANELFGDLSEPKQVGSSLNPLASDAGGLGALKPASDPRPPSAAERTLSGKIPSMEELVNETSAPGAEAARGNGVPARPPSAASVRPAAAAAVPAPAAAGSPAKLSLALSNPPAAGSAAALGAPAQASGGRNVLGYVLGLVALVGLGLGAFYLLRGSGQAEPSAREEAQPPSAAATATPEPSAKPAEQPKPSAAAAGPVELAVTSEPRAAEVLLDGKSAGHTPATLTLSSSVPVELSVRSPGYATKTEKLSPAAGMGPKHVVLERLSYELIVTTTPPGAAVRVDDKSATSPAPLALGRVDGLVTVNVEKEGFQRATRTLRLEDFSEQSGVMRASVELTLAPLPSARKRPIAPIAAPDSPAPTPTGAQAAPPEPDEAPPVLQLKPQPAEDPPAAEAKPPEPKPEAAPTPAPTPAPPAAKADTPSSPEPPAPAP